MAGYDDDDWVGTPPEGRHTRDQADPDFWKRQKAPLVGAAAIMIVIVILVIAALLA